MATRRDLPVLLLTVLAAVLALPCPRLEAEPPADAPAPAPAQDAKASDPFALPEGADVKRLLEFIEELKRLRPAAGEPDPDASRRYRAARKATERITQIATEADKQLPGYADAVGMSYRFRTATADYSPKARAELLADLKKHFAETAEPSTHAVAAARTIASIYERRGAPEASDIYRQLGTALAAHRDPQIAREGERLLGAARRLELIGKPLEIKGTTVSGKAFDWASYRGKVVLVDFWATWCGPCLRELPNVVKCYEEFHDRGFEVVAISLDEDREALDKFLAREPKPWTTLHDGGFENELVTTYGVMGIPTMFLVDRDGKVISLRPQGPELNRLLTELLGPAEAGAP